MYSNSEQNNKIASFENILDKLENFEYIPSGEVKSIIKNPIELYLKEILPLKVKDTLRQKKIAATINAFNNRHKDGCSVDEQIDIDRIKEIFAEFDRTKTFSFLNSQSQKRRYLLRFNDMWVEKEYENYKVSFIQYLQSQGKFYKQFKQILQLYIRKFSILKNDNTFKEFYKNIYNKYIKNKKYIPTGIENIFNDCDLLTKNAEHRLAKICLSEKANTSKSIMDILAERYKIIRPHTDLYNEIVVEICDLCRKNISKDFYFNILFNEVLNSDIERDYSARIVSEIIDLFDKNTNVSQKDLDNIKVALFKNNYYGDPRLKKITSNWDKVDKDARHTFMTWLAQADLEFFFEIIFQGLDDPHGRKAFWQEYIKSRQLVESHVIFGQNYYLMDKVKNEEERSGMKYKYFVNEKDCSCFILKFNDIYVVEYSIKNNAVFMYESDKFINISRSYFPDRKVFKQSDTVLFAPKDMDMYILKIQDNKGILKIPHYPKWGTLLERILAENGIYKGQ